MRLADFAGNRNCSIARSLDVIGQRWVLLILREAHRGRTRYAEFSRIGIPTDGLASRLNFLVDEGLLERRPYQEPGARVREEYVLTEAGSDLLPVLAALVEWGDRYRPSAQDPFTHFVEEQSGRPVRLAFVDGDRLVDPGQVRMQAGRPTADQAAPNQAAPDQAAPNQAAPASSG